jgi:hypothetical protein
MATSQKQTLLFTEEQLTSLQEASPASPTARQENDSAKKMSATSGLKCLEQYAKFNRGGLLAKMLPALLIGQTAWFSRRCKLTWKLRGTKYSRLYFQLAVSTLRTDATESGLLLTPRTREEVQNLDKFKARMEKYPNGTTMPNLATQVVTGLLPTPRANQVNGCDLNSEALASRNKGNLEEVVAGWVTGLLPTPQAIDGNGNGRELRLKKDCNRDPNQAGSWRGDLKDFATLGMLPTPATRDYKGARSKEALEASGRNHTNSLPDAFAQTGQSSQLNPLFVAEMMGFPPDWTVLPFQSGDPKA